MDIHKNGRLTPHGRKRLATLIVGGQTPQAASEASGVCPRTGVAGVAHGAWIGLEVDHQQRRFLLRRAPGAFWIALAATLLIAADILAEPVGRLDSSFVQTAELGLTVLTSFLVGRNAALLVRSRDIPQHDL